MIRMTKIFLPSQDVERNSVRLALNFHILTYRSFTCHIPSLEHRSAPQVFFGKIQSTIIMNEAAVRFLLMQFTF